MSQRVIFDAGELIRLARGASADKFAERFAHPFLSHAPLPDESGDTPTGWQTQQGGSPEAQARAAAIATAGAVKYLPIVHRPKSTYSGFLSIGRADNCDLVLKEPTISKLHAMFWIPKLNGSWTIADGKSRNGTFVNGARLSPMAKKPVSSGDLIRFGDVVAQFWLPADLYQRLLAMA
jgi:pSer/pThr/pTyr-binding forkhead associated (FHA) protein